MISYVINKCVNDSWRHYFQGNDIWTESLTLWSINVRENFEQADPNSFPQITLYTSLPLPVTCSIDWFGQSGLLVWVPSFEYMSFPLLSIFAPGFGENIFCDCKKVGWIVSNTKYLLWFLLTYSPRNAFPKNEREYWAQSLWQHDLLSNWFGATELMQQLKPDTSSRAIKSPKRDESVPKAEQRAVGRENSYPREWYRMCHFFGWSFIGWSRGFHLVNTFAHSVLESRPSFILSLWKYFRVQITAIRNLELRGYYSPCSD